MKSKELAINAAWRGCFLDIYGNHPVSGRKARWNMSDFTPITTQDEFDAAIREIESSRTEVCSEV